MASVITSGASVIAPDAIVGYESSRETGTVVHRIINRGAPDATLRVAGLRVGRIKLTFTGSTAETDSASAEAVLVEAAVFALLSGGRASVQMSFVLPQGGRLTRTLDETTRSAWVVEFDWVEVEP